MKLSHLLTLAVIALTIAGVCAWRLATNRPQTYNEQLQQVRIESPAEGFEGFDADNHLFRLKAYLGRHRVLVVFFNTAADRDRNLLMIRAAFDKLDEVDIKVVGVTKALPQENRAAMQALGKHPFPLVSDVDLTIHRRWGRLSVPENKPLSGVFLIDRKGTVLSVAGQPRPIGDVPAKLNELTQ